MAYTTLQDVVHASSDGRTYRMVIFTGTGEAPSSELTVAGLPPIYTLMMHHVSSSISTQPTIGGSTGWTAGNVDSERWKAAAAGTTHIEDPEKVTFTESLPLQTGSIYWRHNGGGNSDITGVLLLRYGG